jgi:flagellar motor switch protein FliN/FliY
MTPLEEIGAMADVPIAIDVELDRKVMQLREILELNAGSVVKMNRSAGENISIFSGGALVGFGEIVIIEEAVGVRITDFVEQASP